MIKKSGFLFLFVLWGGLRVLSASEVENVQIKFRVYLWPERSAIAAAGLEHEEERETDLKLSTDEWSDAIVEYYEAPEISYFADGLRETVSLHLNEGRLSEAYEYHGPPLMHFFKEEISVGQEASRTLLAGITVSPASKELILLFFPEGSGRYKVLPVETSLETVKAGSAVVYNLTKTKLSCTFGGPTFELRPREAKVQGLNVSQVNYQPILAASQDKDGQWRRRLVQKLSIEPESSMLFVIYNLADKPTRFKLLSIQIDRDE